jgi:hypothetical protein
MLILYPFGKHNVCELSNKGLRSSTHDELIGPSKTMFYLLIWVCFNILEITPSFQFYVVRLYDPNNY